jgi:hypothetical protein
VRAPTRLTLALVIAWTGVYRPSTCFLRAETDLDAFMRQVLASRDDNWKKLQQYVLDEREQMEIRGPDHQPIWGERREYTWYIRDGYFIRSPVKFNGVEIGESDRQRYEAEFLRRSRARDARINPPSSDAGIPPGSGLAPPGPGEASADVDGLLRQAREPQFVSSAYFLRFKFEEGKYALVGREMLDGHEVMRVEYYPANLYSTSQQRRMARDHSPQDPRDALVQRMMNKVALVTLWIEPTAHQIVKYTFDNIDFDFLPAQWLVHLETFRATMTMSQPFPDIWLPRDIDFKAAVDVATGRFDIGWAVDYHDYRQTDVTSKVHIGADR